MNHTPPRFFPIEAFPADLVTALPPTLGNLLTPLNYQATLIRLLTGTIKIHCQITNDDIEQKNNYALATFQENQVLSIKTLEDTFSSYASLADIDQHLRSNISRNNKFYREILFEFYHYFYQKKHENYTAAFLHLYRVLESVAYSLPLMWAAKAKNGYEGTFLDLKKYFSDPKIGELGVLKMFLSDFFDASNSPTSIYNVHVNFLFTSRFADWQKRYYSTLLKNINRDDVYTFIQDTELDIKLGGVTELVIRLRNQYFHFLTGKDNRFTSDDIPDADEFFQIINESVANWLTIILFQMLEFELK